jgi:hypothetical protein
METTTTNYHHPSKAGIERMGVNPKHPEYSSSTELNMDQNTNTNEPCTNDDRRHPIHVMQESKLVLEEWMTTIVPKTMPRIQALVQQVTDLKNTTPRQNHKENVEHPQNKKTNHINVTMNAELASIFDQAIAMEQQIQTLFNRLQVCKGSIHDALEGHPLCTKYLSSISKLPIFGRVYQKTKDQVTLDQYYQHDFLPHYETATVEYQEVMDQCQHILLLVSNTRACIKSSSSE